MSATSPTFGRPAAAAQPRASDGAASGTVRRCWFAVRDDGHGWLLVQFVPQPAPERRREEPKPMFGSAEEKVASLTARERQVLCLVAAGATNCAIAARLFIAPSTASVHVSHILTKLGATTRTEAAGYAHAAGLVESWGSGPGAPPGSGSGMHLVGA